MNKNFREWACSFSGCDGGDPSAPIWICGIEWGFGKGRAQTDEDYKRALSAYYTKELPDEISAGAVEPQKVYDWTEHNKYRFGQSVAKLYLAINGLPIERYWQINELPGTHPLFKMNLYPIAFRTADDWLWQDHGISDITGLDSKETYRVWCFLNRFPTMSRLVQQHSPKIIVGVGVSYLVDFFACFAGAYGSEKIHVENIKSNEEGIGTARRLYWSLINDGKTVLAVVPFFTGSYGLNSNFLVEKFGERIAELQP